MRKIAPLLTLLLMGLLSFGQPTNLVTQQQAIREAVAKHHIAPRPVDDQFSTDFFSAYLDLLDGNRLFFTTADRQKLAALRNTIDDDWNNNSTAFFDAASLLLKTRLVAAKTIVSDICAKPFDFSLAESFAFSDTTTAANDKALAARWQKAIKWEVLQSLMNVGSNQWQTKGAITRTDVMAKEAETRSRIKAKYLARIAGYGGTDAEIQQHLTSLYLNTFLLCLDPHSAFFNAEENQRFKGHLNTESLVFGFALDDNERGEAYISSLAPGSAAWACGLLNKGDVPVQLKWEGSAAVDLAGMEAEDIEPLLDLHTKEKLELVVRKGNGQLQTAILQKQKLENEENVVKSFVLSGRQNIGYIMLPSFYTQWEDRSGSRCAADVAREIVELKKDSIAGLILDLRFNGGGSMGEAIEMAGIFVDEGVMCQVRPKEGKVEALKDMNRGTIWSGPLLVLINGQSASASEMVAGTLQDYNRAIIAGSPSYGKATGQQIFPLNNAAGFAKLTELKLYRPTGKSAQRGGVQPHVTIPDVYGLDETEGDEAFALAADTITAYKYFKPGKPLALGSLQQASTARIADSQKFREGSRLAGLASGYKTTGAVSLKWDDAEKSIKRFAAGDAEKIFSQPTTAYRVRNNTADQRFVMPTTNTDYNAFWLKRLGADLYVEEAFHILTDYIQQP